MCVGLSVAFTARSSLLGQVAEDALKTRRDATLQITNPTFRVAKTTIKQSIRQGIDG